jgi:hypothetical protein
MGDASSCNAYQDETMKCERCRTEFTPLREHARFCSPKCRVYSGREAAREANRQLNPGVEHSYALDFHSVVRHVATQLELEPQTVAELASSYKHVVSGDLVRVRKHHGCKTNAEAITFLIERALASLDKQVAQDGEQYRLTRIFSALRYQGERIYRDREE